MKEKLLGSPATLVIIIVNIIIFANIKINPNIANVLLLNPESNTILIKPWTLVTVFFSHEVPFHLLANMGLLFIFGVELEKATSSRNVFLIYLITGIAGSLTFAPFARLIGCTEPAVGASAAVWGVIAAFAAMYPNVVILKGKAKDWVLALFVGNLVLAVLNPQVSVGAGSHVVGIVSGIVCGFWLRYKNQK